MTEQQKPDPANPSPQQPAGLHDLPALQAAESIRRCAADLNRVLPEAGEMAAVLRRDAASGDGGIELLLATQARVLDSVFNRMILLGAHDRHGGAANMHAALKAQNQCRTTALALQALREDGGNKKTPGTK